MTSWRSIQKLRAISCRGGLPDQRTAGSSRDGDVLKCSGTLPITNTPPGIGTRCTWSVSHRPSGTHSPWMSRPLPRPHAGFSLAALAFSASDSSVTFVSSVSGRASPTGTGAGGGASSAA